VQGRGPRIRPRWAACRRAVPEGRPRIAQRFSAGSSPPKREVPKGRLKLRRLRCALRLRLNRPFGTRTSVAKEPKVETLGYCQMSLRDSRIRPRWAARRRAVPEGRLRIAQRFSAGSSPPKREVPKGRLKLQGLRYTPCLRLNRPFGTWTSVAKEPKVETLGYCQMSLRDSGIRPRWAACRRAVPEGRLRIAQRFSAGSSPPKREVPKGRLKLQGLRYTPCLRLNRPFGTRTSVAEEPKVETLGYCQMSLRDSGIRPRWAACRRAVPEGRLRIAQRFSAGSSPPKREVPKGRLKLQGLRYTPCLRLNRPFGTWTSVAEEPKVETLGYCQMSLRDSRIRPRWAACRRAVPEGRPRIAQRFSAGSSPPKREVPKGRLKLRRLRCALRLRLNRPFGTRTSVAEEPKVETLGYCQMSLRDSGIRPRWAACRRAVPEGRLRIAQRFSAGSSPPKREVPKGRLKLQGLRYTPCLRLNRPFGTWTSVAKEPKVETLGYCQMSLRDSGIRPRWAACRRAVPKGRLRIAQRFSAGSSPPKREVPKGRLKLQRVRCTLCLRLNRPFGTRTSVAMEPKVETLGYCQMSLRDSGIRPQWAACRRAVPEGRVRIAQRFSAGSSPPK